MDKRIKWASLCLVFLLSLPLVGCSQDERVEKPDENPSLKLLLPLKITYGYEYGKGKFGQFDTAKAYAKDGTLLGNARALRLEDIPGAKMGMGRNLVVEETYLNKEGKVIYKGYIIFNTATGRITNQTKTVGQKQYSIFHSWPMGGP